MGEGLLQLEEGLLLGQGTRQGETTQEEEQEHDSNSGHCRAGTENGKHVWIQTSRCSNNCVVVCDCVLGEPFFSSHSWPSKIDPSP